VFRTSIEWRWCRRWPRARIRRTATRMEEAAVITATLTAVVATTATLMAVAAGSAGQRQQQ